MKTQNLAFVALSVLLLGSCNLISRTLFHMSDPKPLTEKKVERYAKRMQMETSTDFYLIDSTEVDETWNTLFPKAFIYDSTGALVHHLGCFATNLKDMQQYFQVPVEKRTAINPMQRHLIGAPPNQDTLVLIAPDFHSLKSKIHRADNRQVEFQKAGYYVVCFWSKSFGSINKKSHGKMMRYIQEHPELNAVFISINVDYMKHWSFTKKSLDTF